MPPKITFNDAWEGVPLEFADDVIDFINRKLQPSHPLRAFKLFPVAKRWRKYKYLVEEEKLSDLLWVLDFDRKKRIRGKTCYYFKRIETQEELDALFQADYADWVKYMKEVGAWEGEWTLKNELPTDQLVQIPPSDHHVSTGRRGVDFREAEIVSEIIKDIQREEGDLALETRLEAKVAVAPDTLTGNALDRIHLLDGMIPGWLSVMSDEVVGRRDEEAADLDHGMELLELTGVRVVCSRSERYVTIACRWNRVIRVDPASSWGTPPANTMRGSRFRGSRTAGKILVARNGVMLRGG